MDNIIYHQPQPVTNSFPTTLKAGIVNPLDRRSYKQLLNINTRFRNNYTITPASDFEFRLPTPIKKVVAMKISCLNLPHMIYTVSANTGSNAFLIGDPAPNIKIDISSGSYSGTDIATQITTEIAGSALGGAAVTVNYSKITGKITFERSTNFALNFDYVDPSYCPNTFYQTGSNLYKDQLTLGWLLGFRKNYKYRTPRDAHIHCNTLNQLQCHGANSSASAKQVQMLSKVHSRRPTVTPVKKDGFQYLQQQYKCYPSIDFSANDISYAYTGAGTYAGEALYDAHGSRYFLLSVNDFQNSHTIAVVSPLQEETLGDGNILAKSSSNCCVGCGMETPTRIYFGPTDISKLHIKLFDEFGRIVDMNNSDFSFTLEVEVLYDL
jgi:hypothetical protein